MQITALGHAGLWIETTDQRILVDPVLRDTLASGAVTYAPARILDVDGLPEPTLLVVTHGHFDHFDPPSVQRLRERWPDLRAVAPRDEELLAGLKGIGFEDVTVGAPWDEVHVGRTTLCPTPSQHDEPEFGLVVNDGEAALWHMADGEVTPVVGDRVRALYGPVDVVSCKYQPVADASVNHLWGHGATFDAAEVADWLEAACRTEPKFAFPYASGLCFTGRHSWFNRYAFPFSAEEVVYLLARRLSDPARAGVVLPGDIVEASEDGARHHPQASPFVRVAPSSPVRWEPVDISTLTVVKPAEDRRRLQASLEHILTTGFAEWLAYELASPASPIGRHVEAGVVWQLVVHAGLEERWHYAIDFRNRSPALARGRHPEANYFVHLSGMAVAEVLNGATPPQLFWLAGAGRITHKVLTVRDGQITAPAERGSALVEKLPDPFTFFLRRHWPGDP